MQRIGPYEVTGEIGRGGMGVVLRAIDPAIGRPVAIKLILLRNFDDPKERDLLRSRLFREAQAAGILKHPGIVTIYYVGEDDGNAYIAMEYVDGPTLEAILRAPQPPDKQLYLRILREAAAALDYAHSRAVIHRDIKPANIMLDEHGSVKICDFGIAKGVAGGTTLTQTGAILGSPAYMSPEQIRGDPVDHHTDQFSLAVTAYEMLTGERPFQAETTTSLWYRVVNDPPRPAHIVSRDLNPAVSAVFEKALAKNPAARYPNCAAFVDDLAAKWDEHSAAPLPRPAVNPSQPDYPAIEKTLPSRRSHPETPIPPAPSGARSRWLPLAIIAAVVVAGLGIAAVVVVRSSDRNTPVAAPQLPPPLIERFTVEPRTIKLGQAAVLTWSVKNAKEIRVDPDIGVLEADAGSRPVSPRVDTAFRLLAKGNGAVRESAALVYVIVPKPQGDAPSQPRVLPPVIERFDASPSDIRSGQPSTLRWIVRNADEITLQGAVVAGSESRLVYPTTTRDYVLEATGRGGKTMRDTAVHVSLPPNSKPHIVSFSGNPVIVRPGESTVLEWEVLNADEARIRPNIGPDIGSVDAKGNRSVFPRVTTKYRFIVTGPSGSFFREVEIKVSP